MRELPDTCKQIPPLELAFLFAQRDPEQWVAVLLNRGSHGYAWGTMRVLTLMQPYYMSPEKLSTPELGYIYGLRDVSGITRSEWLPDDYFEDNHG